MSCAIGAMTQRLEHELETVTSSTATTSAQNMRTAIDHLHAELQVKFEKDRVKIQQDQLKMQGRMNEISESIEQLTQQLNSFKPVNERDLGTLKGEVTVNVTAKLSHTESKVNDLKA